MVNDPAVVLSILRDIAVFPEVDRVEIESDRIELVMQDRDNIKVEFGPDRLNRGIVDALYILNTAPEKETVN